MNNHSDETENLVNAESYYPKSITLGKGTNAQSSFEHNQPQQQATSQNELMTNLLGSLMQKQDSKEKEEKVIDLKNSVEEF